MSQVINISEEDISYAESLLLPEGKFFDDERRRFIKNLNTIDLQAVPGSGKTTALLAKLVILERKLPFNDGSGILVLSHTNAAINEIKEKIYKYCPKLFSYPNFIGTIQSFVDEFLAIPYYQQSFNKKTIRIDNEIYNEKINDFIERPWLYKFDFGKSITDKIAYLKNFNNGLFYKYRFQNFERIKLVKSLNGDILSITKPRGNTKVHNYVDYTEQEKTDIYNWLLKFKSSILESGILHFDDAYFLADRYISKYPSIKQILQKRFTFVFVDEMQDMDLHQYNLIESIFFDEGNSISKIQRIGDKNQAIYNTIKSSNIWTNRTEILSLNGSQRLSNPIANVVKNFALFNDEPFDIIGLNECQIKPHILIFEDSTINHIIPTFAQIVKDYSLTESKKPVKVICWNTDWKEDISSRDDITKLRLEDYHNGYIKEITKPKKDYNNLKSYLVFYEKKNNLESIRKNILNAFLKILRLENINNSEDRYFSKKSLLEFIKDSNIQKYEEINLNIFNWSIGIIQNRTDEVFDSIKAYIPNLLNIFDKTISISNDFINDDNVFIHPEISEVFLPTNCFIQDDLEIEITSVHAVKGQTHCATLYLESYYQKDGNGTNAKSYESQRLKNQFLGKKLQSNVGDRVKQSAKMAYVGFSRPTDLLCIAIHKDRFENYLSDINTELWQIKTVETM